METSDDTAGPLDCNRVWGLRCDVCPLWTCHKEEELNKKLLAE